MREEKDLGIVLLKTSDGYKVRVNKNSIKIIK